MSTTLEISITKEILEKTKSCNMKNVGRNCAIGKAIVDIFPNATVGSTEIWFGTVNKLDRVIIDTTIGCIKLPQEARNFIMKFDNYYGNEEARVNMKPFSFKVEIPDNILNMINIDELRPLLINHPTLKLEAVND